MSGRDLLPPALALVLAPLLPGVVGRTKSFFAGRQGPPTLQLYHDLWKLLRKGAVYSRTTSWVFRGGPVVGLAATLTALAVLPLGAAPGLLRFEGDALLLASLLALARFATVVAALDTGSSFEGMGASREVQISALAEPGLLLAITAAARHSGSLSLSGILPAVSVGSGPALALAAGGLLVVFLAENARIPVDDPSTHLELTMVHEAMILDHGGPDLAFLLYASALKLWVLGALLAGVVLPVSGRGAWVDGALALAAIFSVAVVTGVIESTMARLRLVRVPQLLAGAAVVSIVALLLSLGPG